MTGAVGRISDVMMQACAMALLCAVVLGTAAQGETRLSLDEGRKAAGVALQANQPAVALELAMAVLQANPRDARMLVIVSQAERVLGNAPRAAQAGQAAWRFAQTGPEKYAAAVVTAQALTADKKLSRAQIWLRRAAQHAPGPAAAAMVAQDYGRVRQANPLELRLAFNLTPSSNINNGSAKATTTFDGIPFVFTL